MYEWYLKVKAAFWKIEGIWGTVETMAKDHPELKSQVVVAFQDVLGALATKDAAGVMRVVADVEQAYIAFADAYKSEDASGALNSLIEQLKAIAA